MNESVLLAVLEWTRPRANLHWVLMGNATPELVRVILDTTKASQVTIVAADEADAESLRPQFQDTRVTVRSDEYDSLRKFPGTVDVTLDLTALEKASEPTRIVNAMSRVTRLYGLVLGVEPESVTRRMLWDWWLDARLNDVSSSSMDGFSMVRGTR
jgi:hypothetical protein